MTTQLSPAEASLLRAARLLRSASQIEVDLDLEMNLSQILVQDAARMLTWQAVALLPERVEWNDSPAAGVGLVDLLQQAETQLRTRPIGEYPAGTSRLIVDVCDVITAARAGAWT